MRAILTYHSVDETGSVISISPDSFRRHVAWLAAGKVAVLTIPDLLRSRDDNAVALTFDDGMQNFADTAWPLLREHGLPATLFVATGHVGRDNAWRGRPEKGIPSFPLMGWDTLAGLSEEGLSVGSHSVSHRRLTSLDSEALEEEFSASQSALKHHLGVDTQAFCYPYGACNDAVAAAAARHYRFACTTDLRPLPHDFDPLRLPRLDSFYLRAGGALRQWGSPVFAARLSARRAARALSSLWR